MKKSFLPDVVVVAFVVPWHQNYFELVPIVPSCFVLMGLQCNLDESSWESVESFSTVEISLHRVHTRPCIAVVHEESRLEGGLHS